MVSHHKYLLKAYTNKNAPISACGSSQSKLRLQSANTPMQYTAIFQDCKNDNFQMKNCDIFLSFAKNHRLWVHVRTSERHTEAVQRVSTIYVSFREKKNVHPVKPRFTRI